MIIYWKVILCDIWSLLLLMNIFITKTTSSSLITNDLDNNNDIKRAEEYIMTSATIDGIKRSNVCDDGYRVEGALLKSYPFSKGETYLPYEDCSMTFQARRMNYQIRIRILTLDLNDIHAGVNCLDSLKFYKSSQPKREDRLNTVECGQLTETDNFTVISPTGIVTAQFSTDAGNVNGLGFKVVLTAFRYPNKTHPCEPNDEEYLCSNGDCISSLLLCDGVSHCIDGSDELSCHSNSKGSLNQKHSETTNHVKLTKRLHWRGISILTFLFIIFIIMLLFLAYFLFRRCVKPPMPLINGRQKNYSTIVNSPLNGPKTEVIISNRKRLDDDYNLI